MQQIIKNSSVRRVGSQDSNQVAGTKPTEAVPHKAAPGILLHRADGRVHAIEVTCSCGETKLIELTYGESEQ